MMIFWMTDDGFLLLLIQVQKRKFPGLILLMIFEVGLLEDIIVRD